VRKSRERPVAGGKGAKGRVFDSQEDQKKSTGRGENHSSRKGNNGLRAALKKRRISQ